MVLWFVVVVVVAGCVWLWLCVDVRLELRCNRPPPLRLRSTSELDTEETEFERRREKSPPDLRGASCEVRVRWVVVGGGAWVGGGTGSLCPKSGILVWVGECSLMVGGR